MKKLALVALSAVMLTACGDNKKKKENNNEPVVPAQEQTSTQKEVVDDSKVTVDLSGNDQMQYDKNEIRVKAGQKVTLNLHHTGTMDKKVMGHNFVLLKPGTDVMKFANEAAQAADNKYIPRNTKEVIAYTDIIGGGESTTIVFDAPEKGTYDFICSFPGHVAMMKGKFIVE